MPPIDEKEHEKLKGDLDSSRSEIDNLKKELEKFKSKPAPKDEGGKGKDTDADDDNEDGEQGLLNQAKKSKKDQLSREGETKRIEKAVTFNVSVKDWHKNHKDLIPSEIEDIFKVAEKENYDSSVDRANALRDAIIQSFFAVQANMDLLTATQKAAIDDYLKLTKNGREQRAENVFENVFEPALELMKRVKKAEEIYRSKGGLGNTSNAENAYKEKLIKLSKTYHLGEKYGT